MRQNIDEASRVPLLVPQSVVREALGGDRVEALLGAIERSLVALAARDVTAAPTLHLPGLDGGFHLKAARGGGRHAVVKINGNFPGNPERFGLPTIQGVVALLDLRTGSILALLDSIALTSLRTAGTSAVAARWLGPPGTGALAIIGCGMQGRDHLEVFAAALPVGRVAVHDRRPEAAAALARRAADLGLEATVARSVAEATRGAAWIVTATTSSRPWLADAHVGPSTFVAAVGADNPTKAELAPDLLARSVVIVDSLDAASSGGDLRGGLAANALRIEQVRAELPAVVAGLAPGRLGPDERIVFDSTGLAATDLAAASLVHEFATAGGRGRPFDFAAD